MHLKRVINNNVRVLQSHAHSQGFLEAPVGLELMLPQLLLHTPPERHRLVISAGIRSDKHSHHSHSVFFKSVYIRHTCPGGPMLPGTPGGPGGPEGPTGPARPRSPFCPSRPWKTYAITQLRLPLYTRLLPPVL